MKYNILPYPQKIDERKGKLDLCGITVATESGIDRRVVRAAVELRREISELTGTFHTYKQYFTDAADGMIAISFDPALGGEAYILDIRERGILIKGGDGAGCFYGIATLRQLMAQFGAQLPCVYINDKPGMSYRGFYHDATRGRVPTLESMKDLVDTIAHFKGNSLQLYVEHVFDFEEFKSQGRAEDQFLTAEELLELDAYCYDRFIDFVPSLSTFGHLYELLVSEEYKHLCELEGYDPSGRLRWYERMAHHTIDPSNPESIEVVCSLIDQYLPLFRSQYFNICCDETFDLGQGRNKGGDTAHLYVDFVNKISEHVRASGKTTMMWGDILLHLPDKIEQVQRDNIILNWKYNPAVQPDQVVSIAKTGYSQIVCPGNASWNRFIEDINTGAPNITRMAKYGYENGAMGILNTNWGDFGHLAPVESCLYGTVLGICCGWNEAHTEIDDEYDALVSKLVYGQDEDIVPVIRALGGVSMAACWRYVTLYSVSGNVSDMQADEEKINAAFPVLADAIAKLTRLPDCKGRIASLVLSARSTELLCRIVLCILKGDKENMPFGEFSEWREYYGAAWLATCKQSELHKIGDCLETMMKI